jgi:tetratricopeptide (TPR) repeat protein
VALLGTSIGFWLYCNNGVSNILAGIALFEVFHDTQYLSLVWIYNRNRVEKDSNIGGFMRFVFRRSGALVGLYIGLVFAYGSLGYFNSRLEIETIKRILTGVVAASGLLHFYYDGFIWKVREKSTRESLGLTGGAAAATANQFLPSWLLHGLKWVAIFVVPLSALCIGQIRGPAPEEQRGAWLVADLPVGGRQHMKYGLALKGAGQPDAAIREFNIALGFDPNDSKTHANLGSLLLAQDKVDAAAPHLAEALRLAPEEGDWHYDYAFALERLGRNDEAREHYEAAVKFKPKTALYHHALGGYLARTKQLDQGIAELRTALRLKPDFADAHFDLAGTLWVKGDLDEAKAQYLEAIRLEPKRAAAYISLGDICLHKGQASEAILHYEEALRLDPHLKDAQEHLQLAQATERRFQARPPR